MSSDLNWEAYKAQVAATMLPIIYPNVLRSNSGIRNANDVAADETIELAIAMAEKLEKRLKRKEGEQ
jgi:hypothetical protein